MIGDWTRWTTRLEPDLTTDHWWFTCLLPQSQVNILTASPFVSSPKAYILGVQKQENIRIAATLLLTGNPHF